MGVEFHVLGPLELLRDGVAVQPTGAKLRRLLAVLLVHRNRVVAVDTLIDSLWGDVPPPTATGVLQTYVSQLRKVLGSAGDDHDGRRMLVTAEPGYRLQAPVDAVDADLFDGLLTRGRAALGSGDPAAASELLRQGLALWRGPAFADVADDEAIRAEAMRLDDLRLLMTEERIEADIAIGRHGELVSELRQLVSAHPLRERMWGQLMLCLYRERRQAEALRAFQDVRRELREALGLDPGVALVRLERDILRQAPSLDWSPPRPPPSRPKRSRRAVPAISDPTDPVPFVGRRAELAALRAWWRDGDAARLAIVSGDAGVGKTRLIATFARELEESGVQVLHGQAREHAGSSYEPVLGALRQLVVHASDDELGALDDIACAALSRIVPEMSGRRPEAAERAAAWTELDRSWLLGALAECFTSGDGPPVLLVLDDLHWADRPALLLLARIVGIGDGARVVGTVREPVARGHGLSDLFAELRRERSNVFRMTLGGLTRDDVAEMTEALARGPLSLAARSFAADVHRRTGGNTFFVRETLRHLQDTGAISPGDDQWASERPLDELGIPPGVKEVLDQRFGRLDAVTAAVLRAAAVVGSPFDLQVVRELTDHDDVRVLGALEDALAAGFVREHPDRIDRYEFVHALVPDALLHDMTASRRVRLEWRTGEVLEALRDGGADRRAAELARHFVAGVGAGEPAKAARWATRAAEEALEHLAFEEAVRYYDLALQCVEHAGGSSAEQRADLLTAIGRACSSTGDVTRWRRACLDAAAIARSCGDAERLAIAAITLLGPRAPGEVEPDVAALLEEAATALGAAPASPARDSLRAEVLARLSGYLSNVEPERSAECVRHALEIARRSDDGRVLALALMSSAQAFTLPKEDHLAALREAADLADRIGDVEIAFFVDSNLMSAALMWADRDEYDRRLGSYAERAERLRSPRHLMLSAADHVAAAALDGHYAAARAQARGALRRSRAFADHNLSTDIAASVLPANRELGTLDIEAIRATVVALPNIAVPRAALIVALCEHETFDEAGRLLSRILAEPEAILSGFQRRVNLALLAEGTHRLGDAVAAARLLDWLRGEPRHGDCVIMGPNTFFGSVRRYLGLLTHTLGHYDEAVTHHEAALEVHRRLRASGWAARSRYDLARALLARDDDGDRACAARLLGDAAAAAASLGMTRLVSEVRSVQD